MTVMVEWRRGMLAASVFAALLAPPRRAEATEFHWYAPVSCPAQDVVVLDIERALGAPIERFDSEAMEARVTRSPEGFTARLHAGRGEHQASRELAAPTCEELAEMVALAAALSLGALAAPPSPNPSALAGTPAGAETTRADAVVPDFDAPAPEAPAAVDAGQPAAPLRLGGPTTSLLAAVSGDSGSLPSPTVGVELGVDLRWSAFRLRGVGSWFFERNGQVGGLATSAGARLGLATGTLLGCSRVSARDAELPLSVCTGVEAGQLRGQGTRVAVSRSARVPWVAVRLEMEASWRPAGGPLMLNAGVGAAAPLLRDEFVLADIGSVYRPGSVVGRLRLGFSFDLD